jgi:hypothetical protein
MNRNVRKRKTRSFAGMRMAGRFAATSLDDIRRAGKEAGGALKRLK